MSKSLAKRPLKSLPVERRSQIALEVLGAYANGEEVADIAPTYGVSDVTLYALLIRDHEEEWKQAQIARALAKRASSSKDLETLRGELWQAKTAHDALSLARIREQIRLAEVQAKRTEWELERVYRRVYGQDALPSGGGGVQININLRREGATIAAQHDVEDGVLVETTGK